MDKAFADMKQSFEKALSRVKRSEKIEGGLGP